MVQLIEEEQREFRNFRIIRINCKKCGQEITDFINVKSIGKFWIMNEDNINWDTVYSIKEGNIICHCEEKLGVDREGTYHLYKKSIELTY